jgi:hypothetical protein
MERDPSSINLRRRLRRAYAAVFVTGCAAIPFRHGGGTPLDALLIFSPVFAIGIQTALELIALLAILPTVSDNGWESCWLGGIRALLAANWVVAWGVPVLFIACLAYDYHSHPVWRGVELRDELVGSAALLILVLFVTQSIKELNRSERLKNAPDSQRVKSSWVNVVADRLTLGWLHWARVTAGLFRGREFVERVGSLAAARSYLLKSACIGALALLLHVVIFDIALTGHSSEFRRNPRSSLNAYLASWIIWILTSHFVAIVFWPLFSLRRQRATFSRVRVRVYHYSGPLALGTIILPLASVGAIMGLVDWSAHVPGFVYALYQGLVLGVDLLMIGWTARRVWKPSDT